MNTPSSNVGSQLQATAAADVAKAKAWLGSNWYPFGIGAGSTAGVWAILHFLAKVL